MADEFVPEADALEQRLPVEDDDEGAAVPRIDLETPEADALEQSLSVPVDDGYETRA